MKKVLIVLSMLICLFGLTGCGSKELDTTVLATEEEAEQIANQIIGEIVDMVDQGMDAYYESDATLSAIFSSWNSTIEEIGNFKEVTGYEVKNSSDKVEIIASIACENGDGTVDIVLDESLQISSVTTEVNKTFGQLMKGAALNMVLGMGTVFVVLILIIFIISAFAFIPKIEAAMGRKKADKAQGTEAVGKAVAQIERNEELSDDLELVAVIAAAIAASEGAASTDGFVVRSIKRANTNKWQRA
ncbi:MAG: DUF3887 domain-containing protein [Lachnospiraceae bacterium]|nr:DUF3887 domain-containing protein [Lachnospiraceae bacterium]